MPKLREIGFTTNVRAIDMSLRKHGYETSCRLESTILKPARHLSLSRTSWIRQKKVQAFDENTRRYRLARQLIAQ